jgi:RES domain-containing protein
LSRDAAVAEYEKVLRGSSLPRVKRELVTLEVVVDPVLDLRSRTTRRTVGVTKAALTGDAESDLGSCLAIADWARSEGYSGIISPSAAQDGGAVLAIYVDGPVAGVELYEGGTREVI